MMTQQPAGLNRAQRREQARRDRRKKQPAGTLRRMDINTVRTATAGAAAIDATRRAQILSSAREGFERMRAGVASFDDWTLLVGMVNVAHAIEAQGVVRGLQEHLAAAERALEAIYKRVQDQPGGPAWGKRTTLYFQEIEALSHALELHDFQLQHLSGNELDRARQRAINQIHAMRDRLMPAPAEPQQVQEKLV